MITLNIKPLSVNSAWLGRRFKSKEYKRYTKDVNLLLPPSMDVPEGKLTVYYNFYFSNAGSDWDNAIKQITDIVCKKYGFNDNRIYKGIVEKFIVPKGSECIKFEFKSYKP
jgi:Holliday junction resolvase RusA-like endonuclease